MRLPVALRVALLVTGVCACSTAALLIKAGTTPPLLVAAYRQLIAASLLSPLYFAARRRHPGVGLRRVAGTAWPAALCLALHFWSWNVSVRMTAVANASLIVNLTAVAMPFVAWAMARERVAAREVAGTVLALAGTGLLAAADFRLDRRHFAGDMLSLASMLAFTVYLAWNRRRNRLPSLWLYVPPVYLLCGLMCLLAGWAVGGSIRVHGAREWLLLAGLGVVPTIAGHTLLNLSMRVLRSQLVAIVNLGQFIPAGFLAWLLFGERPAALFPVAAGLVLTGAAVALGAREKDPATQPEEGRVNP